MTTTAIATLAEFPLQYVRCSNCIEELPPKAEAEAYKTEGGAWLVVRCPRCTRSSVFSLEASA